MNRFSHELLGMCSRKYDAPASKCSCPETEVILYEVMVNGNWEKRREYRDRFSKKCDAHRRLAYIFGEHCIDE